MTEINKQFFHLLQCALWGSPADPELFSTITPRRWTELYQFASRQALTGLIYDAMCTLPDSLQPERSLRLKWFMMVQKIEQANLRLNSVLGEVSQKMEENEIDFVLLKGQGQASFYPNPLRRQSGDIDLFFPTTDDYRRVQEWIAEQGVKESASVKHISIDWNGAHVEFHDDLEEMHYPPSNRRMQAHYANCIRSAGYERLNIQGVWVNALPAEANLVYMMLHILNHFISGGIGLRQLCDWALYATAHEGGIDRRLLTELLKKTGLRRFANAFAQLQVDYLGVKKEAIPYEYTNDPLYGWLLDDILEGGNFGFYHSQKDKRPDGKWLGKMHTARKIITRGNRFFRFSPTETLWFPIHYSICNIKMMLNGRI